MSFVPLKMNSVISTFESASAPPPTLANLPLVSVIALCYNHERFLKNCLESVRSQTYPNLQIIIMDDCSKDSSVSLIREWISQNSTLPVTFIAHEQNRGICKTLNEALSHTRGKYISMVATDDAWEPEKIFEQVTVMESLDETVGVIYSDAFTMNEAGVRQPKRFVETYRNFRRLPEGNIHELLWEGNFIPAMATLIRRSVFEAVGKYDESLFYEDWDMWLRISRCYRFASYPKPTAHYRVFSASMSKSAADRMNCSNEIIFTKNLLESLVPRSVRNKAFNFAVRRAFRQKLTQPKEGKEMLEKLMRRYRSPRLVFAWILFKLGLRYSHYERMLSKLNPTHISEATDCVDL